MHWTLLNTPTGNLLIAAVTLSPESESGIRKRLVKQFNSRSKLRLSRLPTPFSKHLVSRGTCALQK